MFKVLVLTDSLALPRNKPEICTYEETWPNLLRNNYIVHQVSIGAATSDILLKQVSYHKLFNPDIVILQVGIVDCAPRFMSRLALDITYQFGLLGKFFRNIFNRKWIRKRINLSYVNQKKFRIYIKRIQAGFDCPLIALSIIPASDLYEEILPGVRKKIDLYNKILKEEIKFIIETDNILKVDGVMTDHHHINKNGHRYIYGEIEKLIDEIKEI
jgi:hypothetical protein